MAIILKDQSGNVLIRPRNYSATDEQVQRAIDARITDGTLIVGGKADTELPRRVYLGLVQGTLNNSGDFVAGGTGYVSEYIPCVGGEKIMVDTTMTQLAFYDARRGFISSRDVSSAGEEKTPSAAEYLRIQTKYNRGTRAYAQLRYGAAKNQTFRDLIMSPLITRPNIQFCGDSNTYGYGLADRNDGWANVFSAFLAGLRVFRYESNSQWVNSGGIAAYSGSGNAIPGAWMEISTDASRVDLTNSGNYSSAWEWYVDDVKTGNTSDTGIDLDGDEHIVRVQFTAGQMVNPVFNVSKTIACINRGVTGTSSGNVQIDYDGAYDWTFIMIGTNNRSEDGLAFARDALAKFAGKCTYILPFPTWKTDASYEVSLGQMAAVLSGLFADYGCDILDCNDVACTVFRDGTELYQDDKIHFSEFGHRLIANIVSAKLGLPMYA